MNRSPFLTFWLQGSIVLLFATCILASGLMAWPFADYVIEYNPGPGQWTSNPQFNDPARALGRPYGISVSVPDNSSVVTLGDGGSITLGFNRPVWDDPRNPHGLDFIVFGNACWVGGDPSYRWQEPAFVEISMDANRNGIPDDEWFLVLPNKLPSQLIGAPAANSDTGYSRSILRHYADCTPTLALPAGKTPEEFYTFPDRQSWEGDPSSLLIDEGSGGGDAFDIAAAVKQISPGVPITPYVYASIPYFNFIRITDAIVGDSQGILGEVSAEIDAVADVSPLPGGETIGQAKSHVDGTVASLSQKVVTAVFPGEMYIQEEDRSSGIRVLTPDNALLGDRVDVIGLLKTVNGERVLDQASVHVVSSGERPKPLGMTAASVGGRGLSNAGLLVRTWGRVRDSGVGWFDLTDGSLPDPGLRVLCDGISPPIHGSLVLVIGPSAMHNNKPALRVCQESDILVVAN